MNGRRRAVDEPGKRERRHAIVAMAWAMAQESDYATVTMADIATRLNLAKGTLYLYFPTKESLFLTVVEEQLDRFFAELGTRLHALSANSNPATIAQAIITTLNDHRSMVNLLAIVHTTIEPHVPPDGIVRFKDFLAVRMEKLGDILESRLVSLEEGEGMRILLQIYALIIGLYHIAEPSPTVRQILRDPAYAAFAIDFAELLRQSIQQLLVGTDRQRTTQKE